MKKNIKKLIKEDFQKSYSCGYNKEEVLQNFVVKEKDKELIHTTKRKLILQYCLIGILGILMGMTSCAFTFREINDNNVITQEFREYLREEGYRVEIVKEKYLITIDEEIVLYIYEMDSFINVNYINYYFIVKSSLNSKIILNTEYQNIPVENNSYGMIAKKEKQEEQTIEFSIEIDGKVKNYVLN